MNRFDHQVFLGVVLYIIIFFSFSLFFSNLILDPRTRGLKKRTLHYMAKIYNHPSEIFYSPNEAFWCTDYNAKKPRALRSLISGKIWKNCQKMVFLKNWHFWWFFLVFFQNWTWQGAEVFCVVISALKRFI